MIRSNSAWDSIRITLSKAGETKITAAAASGDLVESRFRAYVRVLPLAEHFPNETQNEPWELRRTIHGLSGKSLKTNDTPPAINLIETGTIGCLCGGVKFEITDDLPQYPEYPPL
jgi:hypothetical protein